MLARDILTTINEMIAGVLGSQDQIEKLYTTYCLNKLRAILNEINRSHDAEPINAEMAAPLVELLQANYFATKNTDLAPTLSYHLPHTIACLTIAQEIEKIVGINRYKLLHPELIAMDYVATGTSLNDDSSELSSFMMSDDGKRIIEMQNCFTFAEQDGVLKHTSLVEGRVLPLTRTEVQRLTNFSQEARAYWEAITQKVNFETRGESFGAMLKNLITSLRQGGVHGRGLGRGEEHRAGSDANVGILNFAEWFTSLEPDEQATLNRLHVRDADFSDLYRRLTAPQNYSDTMYCVEIISAHLETILTANPNLYDIYPRRIRRPGTHPQSREMADNLTRCRAAFSRSIAHGAPVPIYGEGGRVMLANNLARLPDLHLYVQAAQWNHWLEYFLVSINEDNRVDSLIQFASAINSYGSEIDLSRIFSFVPSYQHLELVQTLEAAKDAPSIHISDYARYFSALSDENRELLLSQTIHLLTNYDDLLIVIRNLPERGRITYAMQHKHYIDNADKFFNVLSELPPSEETFNFMMEFRHYITTGIQLALAANKAPSPYSTLLYIFLTRSCFRNENELAEYSSNEFSPRFELLQYYYRMRINNGNDLANLLARELEGIRLFIAKHFDAHIQTGTELARVVAQLPQPERFAFASTRLACVKNGADIAALLGLLTFPSESQKVGFAASLLDRVRSDEELANIVKYFQFNDGCYLMKLALSKSATISNPHVLLNNSLFSTPKNPPQSAVVAGVIAGVMAARERKM